MMEDPKTLIMEELTREGSAPEISDEIMELDQYRITTESNIEDEEFLFTMKGQPCFPRKDLTAFTGQAKSGKTMLISILMACCVKEPDDRTLIGIRRVREEPLRVMWFDTEQSPHSTKDILKNRIVKLVQNESSDDQQEKKPFPEELFYAFNIRPVLVANRYDLIANAVEAFHPDIVIIDNLRDLVNDINDGVKSQEIIERLMKMAVEYDCNIVTVLHQNRSADNRGLRGWLGTELMNKVFEMYTCQKLTGKPGERPTFCVEQSLTRKYDMEMPLCYTMDKDGIPVETDKPQVQPRDAQGRFASYGKADIDTLNRDYIITNPEGSDQAWEWDLCKLFSHCIGTLPTVPYQDLKNTVMKEANIKSGKYYEKLFTLAEEEHVVRKTQDRCGRVVVMLDPS
jgi:KaiC/GvpD/RAD55 family RecA-like ATPase